jgi:hypothetical protein
MAQIRLIYSLFLIVGCFLCSLYEIWENIWGYNRAELLLSFDHSPTLQHLDELIGQAVNFFGCSLISLCSFVSLSVHFCFILCQKHSVSLCWWGFLRFTFGVLVVCWLMACRPMLVRASAM